MSESYQVWYRDEDAKVAVHSYDVTNGTLVTSALLDDLIAAIQGLSNANVYQHSILDLQVVAGAAAIPGPYDASDKCVLLFRTAIGTTLKWIIPAPLQTVFLDDDVVDEANALVTALIAAAVGTIGGPGGEMASSFIRGWRDRRRRSK